jgi:hypothetical protein
MLFFFSYARGDLDPYLEKFYEDLRAAVGRKSGEPNDSVGFHDLSSIQPGTGWPDATTNELRACKVFVYLHTGRYYSADGCGREFRVIMDRVAASSGRAIHLAEASCIQPIYWDGDLTLETMPAEVRSRRLTANSLHKACKWNMLDESASYVSSVNSRSPESSPGLVWRPAF